MCGCAFVCPWVYVLRDELNSLPAELKHLLVVCRFSDSCQKELPGLEAMYLGRFGVAEGGSEVQGMTNCIS